MARNQIDDADISALRSRLAILEAKEQIRDVLHRYCRAVDRADCELLKSVYHPEAYDEHGQLFAGTGSDFAEFIIPLLDAGVCNRHSISNVSIEISGDLAIVESYYAVSHRIDVGDGRLADTFSEGRYVDIFARRDGEWRIQRRRLVPEKRWVRIVNEIDVSERFARNAKQSAESSGANDDPLKLGLDLLQMPKPNRRSTAGLWDRLIERLGQGEMSTRGRVEE